MQHDPAEEGDRLQIYLSAGVVIRDPTEIAGLSERVEAEAIPRIGVPFDTSTTTGEKVNCALCGRTRNHFRGFVVTFADGRRAIVGRDCGERNFFDEGAWQSMEAAAERAKRTALYDARAAPTVEALDRIIPMCEFCCKGVAALSAFLQNVSEELPDLYDGLCDAARRGTPLSRTTTIYVEQIDRRGEVVKVPVTQEKDFAIIPCALPFGAGIEAAIRGLQRSLRTERGRLADGDLTLVEQGQAFARIRELRRDFRQIKRDAVASQGLLKREFWEKAAQWARANPNRAGNYRVTRKTIRHSSTDYDFGEAALPDAASFDLSAFDAIERDWPRT